MANIDVGDCEDKYGEMFCTSSQWDHIRANNDFDYIVVGTGPCALAFINQTFKIKSNAKILMLERGDFHVRNKSADRMIRRDEDNYVSREFFPWQLSDQMPHSQYIKYHHGIIPGFGGSSTEWTGWCPRPTREELAGWPNQVTDVCEKYFQSAEELLGVESVGESKEPIYDQLQNQLVDHLRCSIKEIPSIYKVFHAPLAIQRDNHCYKTFSTVDKILEIRRKKKDPHDDGELLLLLNCVVQNINNVSGRAASITTSQGTLPLGRSKLILAMGVIPPTTLLSNSFPNLRNVGGSFGGHFISALLARISISDLSWKTKFDNRYEFAAVYLSGNNHNDMTKQFHIQLTAFRDESPVFDKTAAQYAPAQTLSRQILNGNLKCDGYIFFCLSALGELDVDNSSNVIKNIKTKDDKTSNLELNISLADSDLHLWETMDNTMFHILENTISKNGSSAVEYWHGNATDGGWCNDRPQIEHYRHSGTIHESSTLMIGDEVNEPRSVVGFDYRPHSVENVYVTGGGLFPRAGSWNPTLTMTALSLHLADSLNNAK